MTFRALRGFHEVMLPAYVRNLMFKTKGEQ
jgi:hypothetical protein